MATAQLPDGLPIQEYAVVFALYPGDPTYYTVVERAPESSGIPGTPVIVAWLPPGERYYVERRNATETFSYYRFKHGGFAHDFGTPTAWYRARPVAWNGVIPNIPREALLDLDLALDDADGTVDVVANGGRAVASIEWDYSTSAFPADPTTAVDTDAEGDVTVTDAFTLTAGQTGYVTVEFYDQASAGGNLLGTLRQSITRPTTGTADPLTTLGTLVLNGDFEHTTDGAYWGQDASRVAIETSPSVSGAKTLVITSAVGDDTLSHQVISGGSLTGADTVAKRRLIQVDPGESFEIRGYAEGYSDRSASYIAVQYDADKSLTGTTTIASFLTTGISAIQAYTVPAGVRYINWACYVGPDASGPRTFAFDNFTARRIDSNVTGIPATMQMGGIHYITNREITVDSSGGIEGSDPGYIYWGDNAWKTIQANGEKSFVPAASITLLSLDGYAANTAETIAYVGSNTARFTGLANTAMRYLVGVRKSRSAGWQYLGDSGWSNFTPNTSDGLIATPKLTLEG